MIRKIYTRHTPVISPRSARLYSYILLVVGVGLVFWSAYPIFAYEVVQRFFHDQRVSPVPHMRPQYISQDNSELYAANAKDILIVREWFPGATVSSAYADSGVFAPQLAVGDVREYTLSIPRLGLYDARVEVGGEDLSSSLVHYVPTSLPGQLGTVNIFGHSTLPQLYDPKNYKTVFTYLPSMTIGDTIDITMGEHKMTYEVFDMFVVKPTQVSVLEPQYDNAYLTLITCVPPGTFWNRLIVKAKIKQ